MVSVILLMAGKGSRMKSDTNKVFMKLGEKPIYEYSLDKFLSLGCEVVCVVSESDKDYITPLLPKNVKIAIGGKERQDSVRNGLRECTCDYVMIHDSARPFISKKVLEDIINNHKDDEAILVCNYVKNTIKIKEKGKLLTLPRSELISAETPQCASRELLMSVFDKAYRDNLEATDDVSLIEAYYPNINIKCVISNDENFKVTTPIDYKLAELLLKEGIR